MKTAVMTLNNRIRLNGDNIRSLEAIWLEKYLVKFLSRKVDFLSRKIVFEKSIDNYYDLASIDNINDYEEIILHNYNLNFFGGTIDDYTVKTIKLLNQFNGRIYYLITDPKLYFQSIADSLLERLKVNKINFAGDRISVDDLIQFKKVEEKFIAIFTGRDYEYFLSKQKPTYSLQHGYNIPLFEFMFINKPIKANNNVEKQFDLCYYGNNRGGYRTKVLKSIFSNSTLKTNVIGFNLEMPNNICDSYIDNNVLNDYIQRSVGSIVIGDKEHENNWITARFFENINNNLVSFIYNSYDSNKVLYKSEFLKEYVYFSTSQKILSTLKLIEKDPIFYQQILTEQKRELEQFNYLKL
jgi:hypothetical protein